MPDVDARLGSVEQRLEALGARMDESFEQVDRRFEQIDRRFEQVDRRFEQVDRRLEQVDRRFEQVDRRFEQVDQRFSSLEAEVQKVRVLQEENASQIRTIAEVQAHHGTVLEQHGDVLARLEKAIQPLTALHAAVQNMLPDHERRIRALEQSRPTRTP